MVRRRRIDVVAAVAALVVPLPALAQGAVNLVTTGPIQQAPALGMPLLFLLAVALAGLAMYRLRHGVPSRIMAVGFVVAMTVLAGLGYAMMPTITISGGDCMRRTTNPYDLFEHTYLMSACPNMIRILEIQFGCTPSQPSPGSQSLAIPECEVGQTLANGDECMLPTCG